MLDTDEIVTEIKIPPFDGKSAFLKMAIRKSIDFPVVNCATAIGGGNARICLNAVYNKPYRAIKAEAAIKGQTISEETAETAGEAAISEATNLAKNKYKIQIAKSLVKKTILGCS